jgi:tetratricopeptide (TPR) repeat protein
MSKHEAEVPTNSPAKRSVGQHVAAMRSELGQLVPWAKRNKLRALFVLSLLLGMSWLVFLGSVELWKIANPPPPPPLDPLVEGYRALDAQDHDAVRKFAMQLVKEKGDKLEEMGEPLFMLGVSIAQAADTHWNKTERSPLYAIAARYLEQAHKFGFPVERKATGHYYLSRSLHYAHLHRESIPAITEAIPVVNAEQRKELSSLLVSAYLEVIPPQVENAESVWRSISETTLENTFEKQQHILQEARIALAKKEWDRCLTALQKIPVTSAFFPDRALLEGELQLSKAEQLLHANAAADAIQQQFAVATETLRGVPLREATPAFAARAQWLLGKCFEKQGDFAAASQPYERIRKMYRNQPEFVPSVLSLTEHAIANKNYEATTELLRDLLSQLGDSSSYQNRLLSREDLEKKIADFRNRMLQAQEFNAAISLTELPAGIIPTWQWQLWKGEALQARAAQREQLADKAKPEDAAELLKKAREDHRHAGKAYEELANARKLTRAYVTDLQTATNEYFAGRDFTHCVAVAKTYLREELKFNRPEMLVIHGESQMALGNLDAARISFQQCLLDYPTHPYAYRARFLLSQVELERGKPEIAQQLLQENIQSDTLSPRSVEWRESLFQLAKFEFAKGLEWSARSRESGVEENAPERVRAGIKDLEQAYEAYGRGIDLYTRMVERFPNIPQAAEARYALGECQRLSAVLPLKRLKLVTIESTRTELAKQADEHRRAAIEQYELSINRLQELEKTETANPLNLKMLRNCYFGKAGTLFDLARYEEAIKVYSTATYRFQNSPESLEAYVRIAACYRLLNRSKEARGTLEQAKIMLKRIENDTNFTLTTPYTRQQWDDLLNWLVTL